MIIQSKQVWIAGQFLAMQLEVNDGKITDILPYGTKEADEDYGEAYPSRFYRCAYPWSLWF